ncbi:MAG: hypothetical protein HYX82_01635 [Chloroflexi bacterium]|nr:hypothetical protein [Chloroflexota bacterium]
MPAHVNPGNIESLIDWFLHSKIADGGKYRAFYAGNRLWPAYPEITAYAISLSSLLYKYRGEEKFLARARECAAYLMGKSKNGGLPYYADDFVYAFDTGVFISGLFDLYDIIKDDTYLSTAKKSLDWLENLWDGEKFRAVAGEVNTLKWAHLPSIHLVKLAIPLLKGHVLLGEEKYKDMCAKLLRWGMGLQGGEGRFILNHKTEDTMLHPHCYATEGYLFAYQHLKGEEYLKVAMDAARWLASVQNSDGSLPRWYCVSRPGFTSRLRGEHTSKVTDATAQAVRIWKLLGINQEGTQRALSYLASRLRNGGLLLSHQDNPLGWLSSSAVCSWATFFYIHAIMLPFGEIEYASELF